MTVRNHGVWNAYAPEPWPEGVPPSALFLRRNSDEIDWYIFSHNPASFEEGTLKLVLNRSSAAEPWVVRNAGRDAMRLFPGDGGLLLEVLSDTGTGEGVEYIGRIFTLGEVVGRPVDLTAYARKVRYAKEQSDLSLAGRVLSMDDRSKMLILGSYTAAQRNPAWTTTWQGVTEEFTVDATTIAAVFDAMQARINACFTTYAAVVAGISSGAITTTAAIDEAFASVP